MRLGVGQVLMHNMAIALYVRLVDDRRIGGVVILEDVARIFTLFDGLHYDILVDLGTSANGHNIVVVNDHVLVEVDHQLIDEDSYGDWLAFNVEGVARLVHDYQVLVLLGVDLEIVEEGLLCPLVLLEQNAIGIWVADFSQEVWEDGCVFFVHPVRALLVDVIVVSFEASVLLSQCLHDADVLPCMLVAFVRRILPANLDGEGNVPGVVQL